MAERAAAQQRRRNEGEGMAWQTVLTACFAHAAPFWRERSSKGRSRFCRLEAIGRKQYFTLPEKHLLCSLKILIFSEKIFIQSFWTCIQCFWIRIQRFWTHIQKYWIKTFTGQRKNSSGFGRTICAVRKNYQAHAGGGTPFAASLMRTQVKTSPSKGIKCQKSKVLFCLSLRLK